MGVELSEAQVLLINRAIADGTRFDLLRQIAAGSTRCSALCVEVSAPTVSHHLKELEAAGLIVLTREGRTMRLEMKEGVWESYLAALRGISG